MSGGFDRPFDLNDERGEDRDHDDDRHAVAVGTSRPIGRALAGIATAQWPAGIFLVAAPTERLHVVDRCVTSAVISVVGKVIPLERVVRRVAGPTAPAAIAIPAERGLASELPALAIQVGAVAAPPAAGFGGHGVSRGSINRPGA